MSLKGSLETVGLADVLTLLATTGKTGELQVTGPTSEGRVWVKDGRLIASDAGRGPSHLDAVFELLRVGTGSFSFEDGGAPGQPGEATDIGPLLAEATERLGQWHEIEASIPSLDCVVGMAAAAPDNEVIIRADQWRMLASTGGGRPVADVLASMELGEFDGCKALKELADGRLITVVEPTLAVAEPEAVVAEPEVAVAEAEVVVEEPDVAVAESVDEAAGLFVEAAVAASAIEPPHSEGFGGSDPSPVNHGGGEVDLSVVGTPGAVYQGDDLDSSDPDDHGSHFAVVDRGPVDHDDDDEHTSPAWPEATAEATPERVEPFQPASEPPADGAYDDPRPLGRGVGRELPSATDESGAAPVATTDHGVAPAQRAEHKGADAASAASETVATDPAEPAAVAEEPINRGLLLKFLSSVRS